MASSSALAIGMLRVRAAASAPSASSQAADGSTPASARTVESRGPVHSLQLISPWMSWTVAVAGGSAQALLPEHSMKWMRETEGKRASSSMLKLSGRLTRPCTIRR